MTRTFSVLLDIFLGKCVCMYDIMTTGRPTNAICFLFASFINQVIETDAAIGMFIYAQYIYIYNIYFMDMLIF